MLLGTINIGMYCWTNASSISAATAHTLESIAIFILDWPIIHFQFYVYYILLFYIKISIEITINKGMYCWRNVSAIVAAPYHTEEYLAFVLD